MSRLRTAGIKKGERVSADLNAQFSTALAAARARADEMDRVRAWPEADLANLAAGGAMRWAIPRECGGEGLSPLELYLRYEQIAAASLSLALVLSQRDSAVAMIDTAQHIPLRTTLLEALRDHAAFTTVGIAQLTTSRQGGPPALRAERIEAGWSIGGLVPWSTGAARSDFIVAGAAVDGGDQILFLLPMRPTPLLPGLARGVTTETPLPLVALRSSWTGQVRCEGTIVPNAQVLRGPEPKVLGHRRSSLPLGQAFLAMGLCRGGLDLIAAHRSRPAATAFRRFDGQLNEVRREILNLSAPGRELDAVAAAPALRGTVNDLAVRVTHSAVALYKGTALLDTHPAQRLAREAMFLLVWSCPDPVIDCTVDLLSGECQGDDEGEKASGG